MFACRSLAPAALLAACVALPAAADGPQDNIPDNVRPIPPRGNDLPADIRAELEKGLAELQALIKAIGKHELLPDVLIYEKAVDWALRYNEVYDAKNTKTPGGNVKRVLAAGIERAKALKDGKTPWTIQAGPVLRGYRSKIDDSVQPYWLVVPTDYRFTGEAKHRLDFWWHGRGETLSEANFMANAPVASGIIPAPGALILHPYGRYCNANKFAGEIDTFECLHHAKNHYRIDQSRLVARGFSMGGAACWQFGVHYPTMWAACAPGAGFAETPEFLNVFQNEKVDNIPWYEKKLWRMYNATDYAQNLFNLPTVAYSGEIDRQKQAADVMAREMKKFGLDLKHVIGPKTGHSYEKGAKEEVNKLIDAIVEKGKPEWPAEVKFVTYTTRYPKSAWVEVMLMEKQWERGEVHGTYKDGKFDVKTKGIWDIAIRLKPGAMNTITIDGVTVLEDAPGGAFAQMNVLKVDGKWKWQPLSDLYKWHGDQGPIDDAFTDRFVFVRPTGKPLNDAVGKWVEKEMKHAVDHWRKQFRGDVLIVDDTELLKADSLKWHDANWILWGDRQSNQVYAKMADRFPIKWTDKGVTVGDKTYDAATHVPVFIYKRPTGSTTYSQYVVLNSGFTFREYDQLNNARQVPKLPDYAVIDITTPPNSRYPGKIVRAGFFGEKWELLPNDGQ